MFSCFKQNERSKKTSKTAWLASLRKGDQVATYNAFEGYQLHTIEYCESNRYKLTNGEWFGPDGKRRVSGGRGDPLYPVTSEVLASIEHKRLASSVASLLDCSKSTLMNTLLEMCDEELCTILDILEKHIVRVHI